MFSNIFENFCILFPENPLYPTKIDDNFIAEANVAKINGFEILIFNLEELISKNSQKQSTRLINSSDKIQKVIYRGWMLKISEYNTLYNELLSKNYQLINSPKEYKNCHYLPESLKFIRERTPKTIFEKFENNCSIDTLIEKSTIFGANPVIIKDYVKSEKHYWKSACFVPDASNITFLDLSIKNLIKLRGEDLNEGIVIREFIQLNDLILHPKSKMPLTEEYRLFFTNKKLLGIYNYWGEIEYNTEFPETYDFEEIAEKVESNFFTMDIARQKTGEIIVIELGDGQVAGIPENTDVSLFYKKLKCCLL